MTAVPLAAPETSVAEALQARASSVGPLGAVDRLVGMVPAASCAVAS